MSRFAGQSGFAQFQTWNTSQRLKFAVKTSAALGSATLIAYYWPEIHFVGSTLSRSLRATTTLASCTLDYKRNYPFEKGLLLPLEQMSLPEKEELRSRKAGVHHRSAERLLKLFKRNGGIYIKLGQHMSALEHILPMEYSSTMTVLQDQAPISSMADLSAVIREDLGKEIEEVFSEFDETPLGAASLAQVHRAKLREDGSEVAVKIQHHRLQAFVDMDLLTVSAAVKVIKYVFPQFEFGWLADEMRTNLPKELDFISEAHNSERVTKNLERTWPRNCPIHIPKVFWNHVSKRILVMEYCPGAKVTNIQWMKARNINPRQVSDNLTHLYGQMMFLHGFVHCDPHPGNIFVQQDISFRTGFRLVLLDHGLYKELPDDFRLNYAHLWKALISGDETGIRKYSEILGGGNAYKLFSTVLTHRSWDTMTVHKDWDRLRKPVDVAAFREKAADFLPMVADLLARVPKPLLLLLKTNDLLRAVDRALQADNPRQPSSTFLIMGEYCVEAINEERLRAARGNFIRHITAIMANGYDQIKLYSRKFLFRIYICLAFYIPFSVKIY